MHETVCLSNVRQAIAHLTDLWCYCMHDSKESMIACSSALGRSFVHVSMRVAGGRRYLLRPACPPKRHILCFKPNLGSPSILTSLLEDLEMCEVGDDQASNSAYFTASSLGGEKDELTMIKILCLGIPYFRFWTCKKCSLGTTNEKPTDRTEISELALPSAFRPFMHRL